MSAHDDYTDWDAAYVLGALAPTQRRQFEDHLAGCAACGAGVAELAGMPGLLAQLPPGDVLAMDHGGELGDNGDGDVMKMEPPASLMPDLPTRSTGLVRNRWLAPVAAAAAALLIGGFGGYAASTVGRDGAPSPRASATTGPVGSGGVVAAPGRLAFTEVEPSLMTAVVDLVPVANGTELRVECQYARQSGGATGPGGTGASGGSGGPGGGDYRVDYAIWVVDRAGEATKLRDWTARPDRIMRPVGVSALPVGQIASVEIRQVDTGHTVMRASLT